MGLFGKKKIEDKAEQATPANNTVLKMITTFGEQFYHYDGKLYNSDIVRSCIRPKVKAVGKLVAKHLRGTGSKMLVNPDAYIKYLLKEPNPWMTGQKFLEKLTTQLCLNNNAFALVVRDDNGKPVQMYPIPAAFCETVYKNNILYLKFYFVNGNSSIFQYTDIIHLRSDFNSHDIFGDSPAAAITNLMEVIGIVDQSITKAVKNSGIVRWLLKFNNSMRPEDVKEHVKAFVDNYLNYESDTFGAAGVDSKSDAIRIEPKDYVPNAVVSKEKINRVYSFFNTNENIVQSKWTEDEWNAYYEAEISPVAIELGDVFTIRLFNRKERGYDNRIVFDANNLQCASLSSKLNMVQMVDRGAMSVNEWRECMNMAPTENGDEFIRRLDTQVVDTINNIVSKLDDTNYVELSKVIMSLIATNERRGTNAT